MGVIRLGVLGGTFNPIHLGHLHIANRTGQMFGLSQVFFVVSAEPPHKSRVKLVPFAHRYAMVCLATAGIPSFLPSTVELDPPASPFSIDTLAKLSRRRSLGRKVLYFIAGGDSLVEISTWHESEKLLDRYNFVFVMRPGLEMGDPSALLPRGARPRLRDLRGFSRRRIRRRLDAEESAGESRIFVVDVRALDISGSQIRKRVSSGNRIQHLVPSAVSEYIHKLHLYGDR